jgi:hypothetical protein
MWSYRDDIAKEQSIETLTLEHKKILEERIEKINSGNAVFRSWSEVQNSISYLPFLIKVET